MTYVMRNNDPSHLYINQGQRRLVDREGLGQVDVHKQDHGLEIWVAPTLKEPLTKLVEHLVHPNIHKYRVWLKVFGWSPLRVMNSSLNNGSYY